ncbi:MAG TPA: nuclear transport factor 2 family protein [Ignavibacteriaceae bacterium]|nr:nuclear transport factor 2 family protein [Ignavibacteriaceae bacterium]
MELESLLSRRELDPEKLSKIIHEDFFEFGSSGRLWDKKSVIKEFEENPHLRSIIREFKVIPLSEEIVLVTYKATFGSLNSSSESLRSSIWKNFNGEWKIIFHQGTPLK